MKSRRITLVRTRVLYILPQLFLPALSLIFSLCNTMSPVLSPNWTTPCFHILSYTFPTSSPWFWCSLYQSPLQHLTSYIFISEPDQYSFFYKTFKDLYPTSWDHYLFWTTITFCLPLLKIIPIMDLETAQYFSVNNILFFFIRKQKLGQIIIYSAPSISLALCSSRVIQNKISLCSLNRNMDYLVLYFNIHYIWSGLLRSKLFQHRTAKQCSQYLSDMVSAKISVLFTLFGDIWLSC